MTQQKIHAARIEQRMIPGKVQVVDPIRVAHQVERQRGTPAGMQLTISHYLRQRPWPVSAAIVIRVFVKDRAWFCHRAPEGGDQRQRADDAHPGQPVQDGRCGDAPSQEGGVQAVSEAMHGAADIAGQPDAPHPVVLGVHEIISGSQPNLARQVRHRERPTRRSG